MKFQITATATGPAAERARARRPAVERTGASTYVVTCAKGHRHTVNFATHGGQLTAECDPQQCPSRVACYHIAAAYPAYQLDHLQPGDRVLVNEVTGPRWHRFYTRDVKRIYTFEVPEGFSPRFVVDCELASRSQMAA